MRVRFKRSFFAPDGYRYRKDVWHENFPDHFQDSLPKDAEVKDDDYPRTQLTPAAVQEPEKKPAKPETPAKGEKPALAV